MTTSPTVAMWPVEFYNLEEGRPHNQVLSEVDAILSTRPMIFTGCEGVGYMLEEAAGYRLLRNRRDESTSNVFAYVHDSLPVSHVRWTRMRRTWRRVKHSGTHPARVVLKFRAAGVKVAVTHNPQNDGANTAPARDELVSRVGDYMAPWRRTLWNLLPARVRARERLRPSVTFWDPNGADQARQLANIAGGRVVGGAVEGAVVRGARTYAVAISYPIRAAGVPLRSDHKRALRFVLSFPDRWAS